MSRGFGANFGSANGDGIQLAASAITTQHTLSIWFYCHSEGSGTTLGFLWSTAGFPEIYMSGSNTTMYVSVPFTTTSGEFSWTIKNNVWTHLTFVYNAGSTSNVPTVYLNGVAVSVTTNVTPSGTFNPVSGNKWCLGNIAPTGGHTWDGMIAHFAYWKNTLLTAGEALALGSGVSPLLIRPDSLGYYLPLDGVNNPEFNFAGAPYAVSGTAFGSSDPPAQGIAAALTSTLLDMSINNSIIVPWRRPNLTYRPEQYVYRTKQQDISNPPDLTYRRK